MDSYEKLLMTIRREGANYNPPKLLLGEMVSDTDIQIGSITLDKDDYVISEHLTKPVLTELDFTINNSGGDSHSHSWTDKSKYINPVKSGDMVLLYQISDEQFVIIDKVVSL